MSEGKQTSAGARLRAAYSNRCIAMPGVFNALVARMAERVGFEAIYLSGAALSAAAGLPDIGLLSMSEFVERVRVITAASSLPLLVDADTGFGGPLNVERAVREFERAGDPTDGSLGARSFPVLGWQKLEVVSVVSQRRFHLPQ